MRLGYTTARTYAEMLRQAAVAVECLADESTVRERLRRRRSAVWSPSDGRWEVYEAQLRKAESLSELTEDECLTVEGASPLAEQLDRVEAFLRS